MRATILILLFITSFVAHAEYYPAPDYHVYGKAFSEADKIAIDELIQRFKNAWSANNAAAVAATHSIDAEWINAFGRVFRGSGSLKEFLETRLFPDFSANISKKEMMNFKPISRRYIGSDAAIIQAYTSSNRGSALSGEERVIYFTFVLAKNDSKWEIVHQTISDIRERRN